MKMQKKQFRIGELAKRLNVERFVIRFWEKEFNLKAHRSEGGQRFYEERDYEAFKKIKQLLYQEGFTINGAKQQLKAENMLGSHKTTMDEDKAQNGCTDVAEQLSALRKKLIKLRKQL